MHQFYNILIVVYYKQYYWVFRASPSSNILNITQYFRNSLFPSTNAKKEDTYFLIGPWKLVYAISFS
jgi:hypothetical protein